MSYPCTVNEKYINILKRKAIIKIQIMNFFFRIVQHPILHCTANLLLCQQKNHASA